MAKPQPKRPLQSKQPGKVVKGFYNTSNLLIHAIDQTFLHYLLKPPSYIRRRSAPEALSHHQRMIALKELCQVYHFDDDEAKNRNFYSQGQSPALITRRQDTSQDIEVYDFSWPSFFEPFWQDHHLSGDLKCLGIDRQSSFRKKFFDVEENRTCHARLYKKKSNHQRPVLICLHGYGGGYFAFEKKLWTLDGIMSSGFDLVHMILPFHALRKEKTRKLLAPRFPSADPRFTIESFRQVVFDYGSMKYNLSNLGYQDIGLAGMSLGGYCTALIAALDDSCYCYLPIIPLGDLLELPTRQGRFGRNQPEVAQQQKAIGLLNRIIDPRYYTPTIDSSRMHIVTGRADGITGSWHSQCIAQHFNSKETLFEGGHLIARGLHSACQSVLTSFRLQPSLPDKNPSPQSVNLKD